MSDDLIRNEEIREKSEMRRSHMQMTPNGASAHFTGISTLHSFPFIESMTRIKKVFQIRVGQNFNCN